jgi:hypothetical protein
MGLHPLISLFPSTLFSPAILNTFRQVVSFLLCPAIIAAVFLFNAALPPVKPAAPRRPRFILSLAAALAFIIIRLTFIIAGLVAAAPPSGFNFLRFLIPPLLLALLVATAIFLFSCATRLHRKPLGIIAAAALLPAALLHLIQCIFRIYPDLTFIPHSLLHSFDLALGYETLFLFLFWLTVTLFATILALKQPRPQASIPPLKHSNI